MVVLSVTGCIGNLPADGEGSVKNLADEQRKTAEAEMEAELLRECGEVIPAPKKARNWDRQTPEQRTMDHYFKESP